MIVDEKKLKYKEKTQKSEKIANLLLLQQGKEIYVYARGMSMYPFIKNGDKIKISPVNKKDISLGDIVALSEKRIGEAELMVHRVVKISVSDGECTYCTKGDFHSHGLDEPASANSIAGKVIKIKRKNLIFNLEQPLWKWINALIAKCSLQNPSLLTKSAQGINIALEWKLIISKLRRRLINRKPLVYNSEELFLKCMRSSFDEGAFIDVPILMHQGLDWQHFIQISLESGLTTLVYKKLKGIHPHVHIPASVFERLRAAHLYIESRVCNQHRELKELLDTFYQNKVDVIVLKGFPLSRRLYADATLRGASIDLDLLIKKDDRAKAHKLLEELGYRCAVNREIPQWRWQDVCTKDRSTMIDLQWDITMMMRTEKRIKELWRGVRTLKCDGLPQSLELKTEELLLYLCAHLVASNAMAQMRYILDIAQLIEKYKASINWKALFEKARIWRVNNSLYIGVILVKEIMIPSIENSLFSSIAPAFPKRCFIHFFANKNTFIRKSMRRKFMDVFLRDVFFELVEGRSLGEYVAVLKRILIPPKDVMGEREVIPRIYKGIVKTIKRIQNK